MSDGDPVIATFDWDWFVGSLTRAQHLKYVNVSMLVYAIVDYIETFQDEVTYMWGDHLSLVKVLFFVTRYLVFIDVPLLIVYNEGVGFAPAACHAIFGSSNFLCVMATGIAEGLMFMRAHALSKQSTRMRWYLITHYAVMQIACACLSLYFVQSLSFAPPTPGAPKFPCIPMTAKLDHLSVVFALVFFNQLTITMISFYFALTNFRESRGPLIRLLWRDGVLYFIMMSSVTIANFVMSLRAPMEYRFILSMPSRILHATVATRMVLRMRKSARSEDDTSEPALSTMRFKPFQTTEYTSKSDSIQPSNYNSTLEECYSPTYSGTDSTNCQTPRSAQTSKSGWSASWFPSISQTANLGGEGNLQSKT